MKPVDTPQSNVSFVDPDGTLSLEGHLVLLKMADALKEAQDTIITLDARITVLEP